MSGHFEGFPPATLKFLRQLKKNNNRDWFKQNKSRYEDEVLEPSFRFVEAMGVRLRKISPHFLAIPKRTGGSIMRIYRDTRFSKDKTPYKTNIGIHFRHEFGKDVHAPGFYVHVEPTECFAGAGIWRPDSQALKRIRDHIVDDPSRFKRICNSKKLKQVFDFGGESLKRPPRGFEAEHPLIEQLKRKDFILIGDLDQDLIGSEQLVETLAARFKAALPMVRFLCDSLRIPS